MSEKQQLTFLTFSSATPDGDEIIIPDQYLGTPFTCWLGIFLKNSLELAKCGDISAAYENIGSALGANVFYHSPDALLAIYICWLSRSYWTSILCIC